MFMNTRNKKGVWFNKRHSSRKRINREITSLGNLAKLLAMSHSKSEQPGVMLDYTTPIQEKLVFGRMAKKGDVHSRKRDGLNQSRIDLCGRPSGAQSQSNCLLDISGTGCSPQHA